MFGPQYYISISFNHDGKVAGGKATVNYRFDEEFLDFALEGPH